jgi:hypothetical protein
VRGGRHLTALLLPVQQCCQGKRCAKMKDAQVPSVALSVATSVAPSVVGALVSALVGGIGRQGANKGAIQGPGA